MGNPNTGKERARRTADNEDDLKEAAWALCCQLDNEFCMGKAPRSGAGGNQKAYDRLSDVPSLKWRQITTGTRKWAQRYINNCHGQRKFNKASKRANNMYKAVHKK